MHRSATRLGLRSFISIHAGGDGVREDGRHACSKVIARIKDSNNSSPVFDAPDPGIAANGFAVAGAVQAHPRFGGGSRDPARLSAVVPF